MGRRWLKVLTVVAIAAGAAACSDRPTPVAPHTSSTTSASSVSPRLSTSSGWYYVGNWRLLKGSSVTTQTRIAIIDERGGQLNIGGSSLVVPARAVSGATLLSFTLQTQPYISTKLFALSLEGRTIGTLVTTFPVPLTLTLSYADANQQVPDPAQIRMLWLENDVLMGVEPTQADAQGMKIVSQLTHFSDYTPGVPGDPDGPGGFTLQ